MRADKWSASVMIKMEFTQEVTSAEKINMQTVNLVAEVEGRPL